MITAKTARKRLYEWHGGQWSEEYAAASSGLVCSFSLLIQGLQANYASADKAGKQELIKLIEFLQYHARTSDIAITTDGREYYALPWASI